MNFKEYINNPQGKDNAVFSHRNMYRDLYTEKLNKIMVRENGKVIYSLYENNKFYMCHMKIPSEVIENFYYDTVVQFSKKGNHKSLLDADVKFYSNDPSFVFTFAHSFITNKIFINELEDKMSKEAVKKRAVSKNPTNQVGYVKSIYFMYLLMNSKGLFHPIKYTAEGKKYNEKMFKDTIEHADIKITNRQTAAEDLAANKRKKKEQSGSDEKRSRENIIQPNSGNITVASTARRAGVVGKAKTVNKIKPTKSSIRKK